MTKTNVMEYCFTLKEVKEVFGERLGLDPLGIILSCLDIEAPEGRRALTVTHIEQCRREEV